MAAELLKQLAQDPDGTATALEKLHELPEITPAQLKATMAAKSDAAVAQLVRLCKPSVLQVLDLELRSLLDAGLPRAAVAHMLRSAGSAEALSAPLDSDGNTHLHRAAESGSEGLVTALLAVGLAVDAQNAAGDNPLHVAAKQGHVATCRALVEGGADPLRRNTKNRTPAGQVKVPEEAKAYLLEAEEAAKGRKQAAAAGTWGAKMRATQTDSACGVRVM